MAIHYQIILADAIVDADADNHPNNMNYVYTTDDPSKYGDTVEHIK